MFRKKQGKSAGVRRQATSNHQLMMGKKSEAHDRKEVKRERKYPHGYRQEAGQ